jgi:ribosome-associated protein
MAAMERESTGSRDAIRISRSVVLPLREVEFRFSRSSGPGGQHAQRTETRVEAVFDVEASSSLTDRQKARVVAKAGRVLRSVAQDERSQWQNRQLALERLSETLREALRIPRPRRKTRPTAQSIERRLDQKRRRGEVKRRRRATEDES